MASLVTLIVELFVSLGQLLVIFVRDVALRDPLSFVSFLVGGALFTVAFGGFAYLALGALGDWLTDLVGPTGQPPQRAR